MGMFAKRFNRLGAVVYHQYCLELDPYLSHERYAGTVIGSGVKVEFTSLVCCG